MKKQVLRFNILLLIGALLLSGCSKTPGGETGTRSRTAAAQGFGGEVSVTLTTENGTLADVVIQGDKETEAVGGQAILTLQKAMKESQSIDVEAVSGATLTSEAVLSAARQAWNTLNGVETAKPDVKMKAGTYTASAPGFRSAWDIEVSVTVDETQLLAVQVNPDSADTVGIFQSAANLLPQRMVEHQSVAVEAICGATVSSNAIKSAAKKAIVQALEAAGTDAAAISAFETIPDEAPAAEELTTDILVVGLGAAGTTAALSAAETMAAENPENVSVLAIDKAGRYGGASSLCSGVFAVNPPGLADKYNDGKDFTDRDALLTDWLTYVEGDAKPEMIELLLDHSGDTIDWLVEDYGLELEKPQTGLTEGDSNIVLFSYAPSKDGMTVRRQHNIQFYDNCMAEFTKMGGKIMLETEAYDLIVENGQVTGVKARNTANGQEILIHARKVILGTGGFLSNSAMTQKYLSNTVYPLSGSWDMVGMKQNDGKMIESSIAEGAATYNIGMCPAVHIIGAAGFLSNFEYHTLEDKLCMQTMKPTKWTEGDLPHYLGVAPDSLAVNMQGERFTNEKQLGFNAWVSGPNFYSLYSDTQISAVEKRGLRTAPAYMTTVNLGANGWAPDGTPITNAHEVMEAAVTAGFAYKADTVEDLAVQLGMEPETLKQTVEKYNAACAAGVDEEFGKNAENLDPLAGEGPFYAIKMANYPYSTCAALDVNTNLEVLKTDGSVMSGLYAAGLDASGVLYSEKKPYVTYGGVDQGFAFTSGRLAGIHAAASLIEK